jgi:hypothetical protein
MLVRMSVLVCPRFIEPEFENVSHRTLFSKHDHYESSVPSNKSLQLSAWAQSVEQECSPSKRHMIG